MSRRRTLRAATVPLAAAAVLAGCGDDPAPEVPAGSPSLPVSSPTAPSTAESSITEESAPPTLPPPYIEATEWVQTQVGPSLQIHPTQAGRTVSGDGVEDTAWKEVLALSPDADTPGMRAQFDCHWSFARLVEPDKPSWNLEPGRPVVGDADMIAARCNPGFAEEN